MRTLNTLIFIALVVVVSGCAPTTTVTNDADSQSVMDTVIPAVFGHWSVDALVKFADPSVYTPARVARDRVFFSQLSDKLGPMVAYNKAHGTTEISGSGSDQVKRASYDSLVVFKRGQAVIHVDAVKKNGQWSVVNASVQPGKQLGVHP
ncbi:MAG TPA: hypothetical protein VKF82_03930 [Candidatus Eremiobacteraceae bacterium]|nr:hypothetical protein [Candidatus Eremiobacteraceae bacterium]